jgi:glycyl-tRNA synthetase beta chain
MLRGDFAGALKTLATMRGTVDKFFDDVLVNAEDTRVRANRHALLRRLDALMNQVADISKLAVEK